MHLRRFFPALILTCAIGLSAVAQTGPASSSIPDVPTTRVIAIGRLTPGTTREMIMPVMKQEVPDTLRLYLAGKLDQTFIRKDVNGVVFLLNVSSVAEARELLDKLPLGKAKMMEFDLIPVGPLSPLAALLKEGGVNYK